MVNGHIFPFILKTKNLKGGIDEILKFRLYVKKFEDTFFNNKTTLITIL